MSALRDQVTEFHHRFEHPIGEVPHVPVDERVRLRLKLIAEEFFELLEASMVGDWHLPVAANIAAAIARAPISVNLVEFADALADLDYVIEGTRIEFGINGDPIAAEVHRSNMSKLGADGRPIKRLDGKTLKGPNFSPPDITSELQKQKWRPR
jgi:predicted HAD superfamily Cof-like phosphohydrolase